jgi:heptosyltransferase-1
MKVLLIKTSSLGDLIHTFPAVTDAAAAIPGISFDWVAEEAFVEVPGWHPAVDKTIPVAIRRWRKSLLKTLQNGEWSIFRRELRSQEYDLVIDAQGLLKSALITRSARGRKAGFDKASVRESLATLTYDQTHHVEKNQHAVTRLRELFANALGYQLPNTPPDSGIDRSDFAETDPQHPYLVFLHGTTWQSKHYPEDEWVALTRKVVDMGFSVRLPWGNQPEMERAEKIACTAEGIEVLPRQNLTQLASVIAGATGVIAVDTGLAHLAAAMDVPALVLYGPTEPGLTGVLGQQQKNLQVDYDCAPCLKKRCRHESSGDGEPVCFTSLNSTRVSNELRLLLNL